MTRRSFRLATALALASLPATALAQEERIVTGSSIVTGCTERIYHPAGPVEPLEGVYYAWIDNSGFVPCTSAAQCRRFLELASWDIQASEEAWADLNDRIARLGVNWGEFRIRFLGRRGAMTLPRCIDMTQPDVPAYVVVEKLISLEPLPRQRR